jgi:hypothetical protein
VVLAVLMFVSLGTCWTVVRFLRRNW